MNDPVGKVQSSQVRCAACTGRLTVEESVKPRDPAEGTLMVDISRIVFMYR